MKSKYVLLLFVLLMVFAIYKVNTYKEAEKQKILTYYGIRTSQLEIIEEKEKINIDIEKIRKLENIVVYDYVESAHQLKDLLVDKEKLVVKFSSTECSFCIEHIIEYLKKNEDIIGVENIIFLGHFQSQKDFFMFNRLYNLDYSVYRISNNSLGFPVDYLNEPYLLVIDSTLVPIEFFVPNKSNPTRTDKYLKEIIKL